MNIKYKCKDNIERLTLALKLQQLGWDLSNIDWSLVYEEYDFKDCPYINIDNEQGDFGCVYFVAQCYEEEYDVVIKEVKKPKDILIKYESFKEIKIKLNDSYEAIVKSDHVKVGCQTFTFEKIKELYDAISKVKNSKK